MSAAPVPATPRGRIPSRGGRRRHAARLHHSEPARREHRAPRHVRRCTPAHVHVVVETTGPLDLPCVVALGLAMAASSRRDRLEDNAVDFVALRSPRLLESARGSTARSRDSWTARDLAQTDLAASVSHRCRSAPHRCCPVDPHHCRVVRPSSDQARHHHDPGALQPTIGGPTARHAYDQTTEGWTAIDASGLSAHVRVSIEAIPTLTRDLDPEARARQLHRATRPFSASSATSRHPSTVHTITILLCAEPRRQTRE